MPGIEPRASYMQSIRSTTELNPPMNWEKNQEAHFQKREKNELNKLYINDTS